MVGNMAAPTAEALAAELKQLSAVGLPRARHMSFPTLATVAKQVVDEENTPTNLRTETLLRRAIASLDDGDYGDAALSLFGLSQGLRGRSLSYRREKAAETIERSADTFQRRYEDDLLADIGDKILKLREDQQLRNARIQLERRHPAESRLAVQWVERFEAYYRIWTPAWALGADLTAYRSTLLDPQRPYDDYLPSGELGYTQETQAEGYAVYALYRWAWFQWHVRQFMLTHGGMWLLSSSDAEIRIADLVYEIGWRVTVYNERDQSWLRNALSQSRGQEFDHFQSMLKSTATGADRLREWLEWCSECHCVWDTATQAEGRFPTKRTDPGVSDSCQMHLVIEACDGYCTLIEEEWLKIADWYHLDSRYGPGRRAGDLYREWRSGPVNSQ